MEIVIQIAGKIVDYTFAPVGQWLCYSFHYDSNMENLKNQEERLRNFKNKVQHSVDAASRNGEEIEGHVQTWLRNATTKLNEIEAKAGNRSSNAACLNLKHRHQLSREAKNMVENIDQLLDEYHKNGNFEKVSYRPPPEGMETRRTMDYMAMDSRMTAVKDIMEALGNADIDKIGVWGMPGVGKSTLMKEIARQAMEKKLFNEVVMADVTASPDVRRIQERIAFTLGLNFDQQTDEEGRASQLKQRISSKDKKILVILDDIWRELDLQEIGIPSEGCKVVMTSRDRNVLVSKMDAQKDIELKILQEAEAFNLIEKIAGDSFKDQPEVRGVATEIAKKCAGLPIALVTVSKALKNKKLGEWRDILLQLKRPAPEHITEPTLKTIYQPIEVSYNNLESQELKSLFLLCALLPYFLSYRDLLIHSYGWGLFQGIYTLEEARDRLDRRLRELKDSCLLLERSDGFCMHDLVRDVATIIASKDNNMFVMRDEGGLKEWPDVDALKRCQAFSTFDQPPNEMECPELIFFLISSKSSLQVTNTLFQGMEKLKVLDLTNMRLPSLPTSLRALRNLQTLCLDGCVLEDISGIGELETLVVLSLHGSEISKLPREIGSLVRLRMLDLSNSYKLEMIPPNVISSLVKLEELYMGSSIVQWEVEGLDDERKNASLAELKHLSNLNTLEIQIPDVSKLPKDFNFQKLERYKICIGDVWHWSDSVQSSRTLNLKLNSSIQSEFWNKMPLKRLEILHLEGRLNGVMSVIPEIDREAFQQTKYLCIENGLELKYIVNLSTSITVFPTLETFILRNMIRLEEICLGEFPLTSFKNLKVLKLHNCQKLRFVFSSSIARGLSLLEELEIKECNNMGAIVVKEEKDGIKDGDVILFHQLQTLVLEDLPEFVSFLSKKSSFTTDCGQIIAEGNHDLHMPLLHHQVSFPSLQTFSMKGLPKIKHVWSCGQEPKTVFRCIEQLKILEIEDCGVEEIVAGGGGGGEPVARTILEFPRVTNLRLKNLKRLKWFYKGVHVTKWLMLKEMLIEGCEKVEIFASGVVSFEETVKERSSEMSIKQPLFLVDEVSFPSLQTFRMKGLPKIKHVWSCGQEPKTVFRCIEQLKILEIEDCGVEEIVAGGGGGGGEPVARTILEFPRVTNLRLKNLKRLKWFYKGVHVSKWPMLEMIWIEGCEKVEIFASGVVSFEETVKERSSEMSIKQPLFLVDELSFSSLKKLHIRNMDKLEIICQDQVAASLFSKNIQNVEIRSCEKLLHVFQSNVLMQSLTRLFIWKCDSLETIFRNMEGHNGKESQVLIAPSSGMEESVAREDVTVRHIEFPILTEMILDRLPKLKWILEGVHTHLECPSLERLELWECEQVIWASKFASSSSSQEKSQQNKLRTCIQLPLPNLLELELRICRVKLPSTSFKKLRVLKLANCEKLRFIFPSSIARGLSLLEELEIKRCNNMGAIVVKEEKDRIEDGDVVLFHHLQTLVLEDLPELVSFLSTRSSFMTDCGQIIAEGNRDLHMPLLHHQVSFPSLQTFRMKGLPKIKHVWSCGQEPKTVFRCIEQLEILEIEDCGVEEIVAGGGGGGGEPVARTILEFPRVTNLRLRNLKSLKWFYKGVHVTKWPMLGMIEIERCEKVEIFASGVVSFEETVKERSSEMSIKQPLFLVDELSFSSLKKLHIRNMDKLEIICQDQVAASLFSKNIQDVEIDGCEKLLHVFQSNFRTTTILQHLTRLWIWDCSSLETIFRNIEGHNGNEPQVLIAPSAGMEESVAREDGTARHIEFPILTKMKLGKLPKLKWILEGGHTNLECPSLEILELWECEQVILASKFASSSSSQETSQQNQLQTCIQLTLPNLSNLEVWFDGREEIFPYELVDPVPRLRGLELIGLPMLTYLWKEDSTQPCPLFHNLEFLRLLGCDKLKNIVPSLVFLQNLIQLDISYCDGLINLLTSSTAKTLVQLQRMTVKNCKMITEIVAMEDGEANVAITFNKLAYLKFEDLPNLTHFCSGPYSFGFPSLKEVFVTGCLEMKPFCDRVSSTTPS